MKSLMISGLCLIASVSWGAKKTRVSYSPEIKMTAEELLSLPSANREELARERGNEWVVSLEKLAFSPKEDYGTRWKALTLAAQIRGSSSEALLKKAASAPEWYMRNAALVAYQKVLPKKTPAVAEELLKDKALVVRSAAVTALANSADESTRESLWSEFSSPRNFRKNQSLFIRAQILRVLSKDPLAKEAPLFVKSLREDDERLHAPAVAALEKVTSKTLGKRNDTVVHKRELWMKWAKAQDPSLNL